MKTEIVLLAVVLVLACQWATFARAAPKPQFNNFNGFQDQSNNREFKEVKTTEVIESDSQQSQNNGFNNGFNGGFNPGFNQNGFQNAYRDKEFKEVKTTDEIVYDNQQSRDQFPNNGGFLNGNLPNMGFNTGFNG